MKRKLSFCLVFVTFFAISQLPANAEYYPYGIEIGIPEQKLIENGWILHLEDTYSTSLGEFGSTLIPYEKFVLLTGKRIDSDTLVTVAAAPTENVFSTTNVNEPVFINGAYWYFTPGFSIGYSPSPLVEQSTADVMGCNLEVVREVACSEDSSRLSWHLSDIGGFRLGTVGWINSDEEGGSQYLRQVWSWDGLRNNSRNIWKTTFLTFGESFAGSDLLSDPSGNLRTLVDAIFSNKSPQSISRSVDFLMK